MPYNIKLLGLSKNHVKRVYFKSKYDTIKVIGGKSLKKTVLHESHIALGAKMVEFAGFDMPIQYTSIKEEHLQVRNKAGIFDVSHMGEIEVKGNEAEQFVDLIFTNNILDMNDHQINYGMLLYETGGVVDDLLVYKYNKHHFLLVVNASNIDKDYNWLLKQNTFDCTVTNRSDEISEVALQGPLAEAVLQQHTDQDLSKITFFTFKEITLFDTKCMVSRTGYTGEDGFEIYASHETILKAWDILLGHEDVLPIGLGARDTLRFEVALPLYGNELSKDITPVEAGLNFAVDYNKTFIGSEVVKKQKAEKPSRRIVGLTLLDKGILRHGYEVYHEDQQVGFITTGYKSPSVEDAVAMAMIDKPYDKLGTNLEVQVRNKRLKVVVRNKKFYDKNTKAK